MTLSRYLAFTTAWFLISAVPVEAQQWPVCSEVSFTIAKEQTRGIWILNGSTGSVRFCRYLVHPAHCRSARTRPIQQMLAPALGLASVNCGNRADCYDDNDTAQEEQSDEDDISITGRPVRGLLVNSYNGRSGQL